MAICGNKTIPSLVHQILSKSKYVFQEKSFHNPIFNADMMYCGALLVFLLVVND
jgi:hypothetical protein